MLAHDTVTPDVETASEDYARRFAGSIGRYFLETQAEAVLQLLAGAGPGPLQVLEVGGGHAQLTPALLQAGHEVCVQGSAPACGDRLAPLGAAHPGRLRFVTSDLWTLPFPERAFDAVIAVRLLAHVERYEELLAEMARVSRRVLIVDYPPLISANLLEPAMFAIKRRLEGNTRPFFCYRTPQVRGPLERAGFERFRLKRQFFLPMVLHRVLRRRPVSAALESACRGMGLTALLGAPALLSAERPPATG